MPKRIWPDPTLRLVLGEAEEGVPVEEPDALKRAIAAGVGSLEREEFLIDLLKGLFATGARLGQAQNDALLRLVAVTGKRRVELYRQSVRTARDEVSRWPSHTQGVMRTDALTKRREPKPVWLGEGSIPVGEAASQALAGGTPGIRYLLHAESFETEDVLGGEATVSVIHVLPGSSCLLPLETDGVILISLVPSLPVFLQLFSPQVRDHIDQEEIRLGSQGCRLAPEAGRAVILEADEVSGDWVGPVPILCIQSVGLPHFPDWLLTSSPLLLALESGGEILGSSRDWGRYLGLTRASLLSFVWLASTRPYRNREGGEVLYVQEVIGRAVFKRDGYPDQPLQAGTVIHISEKVRHWLVLEKGAQVRAWSVQAPVKPRPRRVRRSRSQA